MVYCPNCGCKLEQTASECPACKANFGAGSAWKPVAAPPQESSFVHVGDSGNAKTAQDYGQVEMVIGVDRAAIWSRLQKLFLLFAGGFLGYYLMNPERVARSMIASAVGIAIVMAMVLPILVFPLLRVLKSGVAFTITNRGILPAISPVKFIAWDEVSDVEIGTNRDGPIIKLMLRDSDSVKLRSKAKLPEDGITLWAYVAEGGAERLLEIIRERIRPA